MSYNSRNKKQMENKMKKAITFFYNHHSGELVKTKVHKNFQEVDLLMKADVLLDCTWVLEKMYKNSKDKYFGEIKIELEKIEELK